MIVKKHHLFSVNKDENYKIAKKCFPFSSSRDFDTASMVNNFSWQLIYLTKWD